MKRLLPILVVFLAVFSCREPASVEVFVPAPGPYTFTVDMQDSTAVYDFDLYTRIDAADVPVQIQLVLRWTSPSDSVYRESVYMPLDGRDVYVPYRSGVQPYECGLWELTVAVPSAPEGLRGMGLVTRKIVRCTGSD